MREAAAEDFEEIGGWTRIGGIEAYRRLVSRHAVHHQHPVEDRAPLRREGRTYERGRGSHRVEQGAELGGDGATKGRVDLLEDGPARQALGEPRRGPAHERGSFRWPQDRKSTRL